MLLLMWVLALQWRHNEYDCVSNHQPHDCLFNRLFRRRSKKTSKLHVTGLCEGNSLVTGEFPTQRASNAENVSIWWRHHGFILLEVHAFCMLGNQYWYQFSLSLFLLLNEQSNWWWFETPWSSFDVIVMVLTGSYRFDFLDRKKRFILMFWKLKLEWWGFSVVVFINTGVNKLAAMSCILQTTISVTFRCQQRQQVW